MPRFVIAAIFVASCASGPRSAGGRQELPECIRSLQGSWATDDSTLHFVGRRFVLSQNNEMRFAGRVVGCTGDSVTVLIPAFGVFEMGSSIDADAIELTPRRPGLKRLTGKRLETPFEPTPPRAAPLGSPTSLPPERVELIQAELHRRAELDQAVRKDPKRAAEMPSIDEDNTAYLAQLIAEVGWIDADRFGKVASIDAFLIVQHSGDLSLMMAALPGLERDAKPGQPMGEFYALLYDRLHLMLGERQRYGSQIGADEHGNLVVLPLEDPTHVDDRRRDVGLPPLREYTATFETANGGRQLGVLDLE